MRFAFWYAATRIAGLAPLLWPEALLLREPTRWLIDLDRLGLARALPEYPWPAAWLVHLPMQLGVPTIVHYYVAVIAFLLACDAAIALWLWRASGRRFAPGIWLWLLAFPALGPMTVTRFDLVPAALTAAALLVLARGRGASAGSLAALASGIKLWPVLVLPGLLLPADRRQQLRTLGGFVLCGVGLIAATLFFAGTARLVSPLGLQAGRGLHAEAFAALPFLWLRLLDADGRWQVQASELCNCHEIAGPGVAKVLALADVVLLVAIAGVLVLLALARRGPPPARSPAMGVLISALMLVAVLATARVFSPQYMLWLAALLAVLGVLRKPGLRRVDVALFVAACALTHLIYPLGYEALVVSGHFLQGPLLAIMSLRALLLVTLGARLAVQAVRLTPR